MMGSSIVKLAFPMVPWLPSRDVMEWHTVQVIPGQRGRMVRHVELRIVKRTAEEGRGS